MRIIYMGTPDFAVESLRRLVEAGEQVVAVVTMPDKAVGRHHDVLTPSPVKQYALSQGIPVLQPQKLRDPQFLADLASYRADLQVVVAFRMLPEVVWAMPPLGTFNLHAALLPQYRGAAPINWAIINGDTQTGVTTFFLDHDIDTGVVIHRQAVPITLQDDAGSVHDRLMHLGAELVLQTVRDIASGQVHPIPQSQLTTDGPLRPAPKIFKDTCRIQWSRHTLKSAYDFIRGLSPYPASWTLLSTDDGRQQVLKIYQSEMHPGHSPADGTLETDGRTYLRVALPGGYLHVLSLQLAGKRRMSVQDFLRGNPLQGCTLL